MVCLLVLISLGEVGEDSEVDEEVTAKDVEQDFEDDEEDAKMMEAEIEKVLKEAASVKRKKMEAAESEPNKKKAKTAEPKKTTEKPAEIKKVEKTTAKKVEKPVEAKKVEKPAEVKKTTEAKKTEKLSDSKKTEVSDKKTPEKKMTKTLPSGLVITETKVGTGPVAKKGKKIGVRYIGRLESGKVFDSNTKGKPFQFKLGVGQVIKGWDLGFDGMHVGGERKLVVPANLGYGASGAPPAIPGNAQLEFEIKLLEVKN